MPSVLAQDIPLLTLQAKNIQVRAEWNMVGDSANHFSVEGGTLMLRPNVSGAGYPEGNTITAIVEVLDKFSTLSPSYEDLTVRVMITAVIMGCHADWYTEFAKSHSRRYRNPPNQIAAIFGEIDVGDVIARRYTENGYNHIYLHTVSATHGGVSTRFITVSPTSLYENLKWSLNFDGEPTGYTPLAVNESEDCFAEEVKTFQEQQEKFEYLNANAPPLTTGIYAGENARVISVGSAFVLPGKQFFWLYNVTLVNIINELYPIKVINNDVNNGGKAFTVATPTFYPKGSRSDANADIYQYSANLTVQSYGYWKGSHQVIIVNSCPTTSPVSVNAWVSGGSLRIAVSDISKANTKYVFIEGAAYKSNGAEAAADGGAIVATEDSDGSSFDVSGFSPGAKIKFSDDHFLCENI